MASKILLKHASGGAGDVPSSGELELRELAINTTDGILFAKNAASVVMALPLRTLQGSLSYGGGTVNIDFTANGRRFLSITGNLTLTTSNRAENREMEIFIAADATPRNFTLPSWTWIGGSAPTSIAASKKGRLKLTCTGTNEADIFAEWTVQP